MTMRTTIPDQPPAVAQPPVCVACVGDGTDPDPAAPSGIPVAP